MTTDIDIDALTRELTAYASFPAKERMVADVIAKWREELEEAAEKGRRDDERMLNGWLFGIEIAMSMIGMSDLALMACRAQKAGKKEAA